MKLTLCGCEVTLSFWFFLAVAAAAYLGGDIALLPAAALLHEAGHFAAILLCGGRLRQLALGAFGARMYPRYPRLAAPSREAAVLLAGPLCGLLAAGAAAALGAGRFAAVNLLLSGFNLLPLEGLDGGSLLRLALVELLGPDRGEQLASRLALAVLLGLLALGTAFLWDSALPRPALLLLGGYLLLAAALRRG